MTAARQSGFLPSIEFLRGIAALSVCLLHFRPFIYAPEWIIGMIDHGGLGVVIFFVISGFILPYSLDLKNYKGSKFLRFLGKRLLRLEPAYLASIALILALRFAATFSPHYEGAGFSVDGFQLLTHLGYLTEILGEAWLNPVFWTLGVELQFYLTIGIIFPLLVHPKKWVIFLTLSCFLATNFIPLPHTLFSNSSVFVAGILTFLYFKKYIVRWEYLAFLAIALAVRFYTVGYLPSSIIATIFAILIILFTNIDTPITAFMGRVSYSLYLLHTPIGSSLIINFALNYFQLGPFFNLIVIVAIFASYFAAWVFYKLFEEPFTRLSKRIKL